MDIYQVLAWQALDILKVPYEDAEPLASSLERLRGVILLPASTTEGEIMMLSKKIADLIDRRAPVSEIELRLKELDSLRLFDLFD